MTNETLSEHPTPSPDAIEAARAMREVAAKVVENWHVLRDGIVTIGKLATSIRALPLPTPQPDERDEALRVMGREVEDFKRNNPNAPTKTLEQFFHENGKLTRGELEAALAAALASIAAAKSKGGE